MRRFILLGYCLILLVIFTLLNSTAVFGYSSSSVHHDHSMHTTASSAAYNQTDCASACGQASRTENSVIFHKETKRKKYKQPHPEPESEKPSWEDNATVDLERPKTCMLPAQEIYKFTCAYLF